MSLLRLDDAEAAGAARVGGKAIGLARLRRLGLPVPPAVVLDVDTHARWRGGDHDWTALAGVVEELGTPLAVRSSATDEDSAERSAAGQYESVMGVGDRESLIAAIERCYREADGDRARAYRGGGSAEVALVVQREMPADRAGIAFSVDPRSGDDGAVLIEAVFGHGEGAVSGAVTPDRFRVSRSGMEVRARLADKSSASDGRGGVARLPAERRLARTLRDDEARAVARLTLDAEAGTGAPVDLEFCFAAGELWALQCRPITTLGTDA